MAKLSTKVPLKQETPWQEEFSRFLDERRLAPASVAIRGMCQRNGIDVLLVVQSPGLQTMPWLAEDSPKPYGPEATYRDVTLALPWLYFFIALDRQDRLSNASVYFLNKHLTSLDEPLLQPHFLNCMEDDKLYSWLCTQGFPQVREPGQSHFEYASAFVKYFWESGFNKSAEPSFWTKNCPRIPDPRVQSVEAWEKASETDPNFAVTVPWIEAPRTAAAVYEELVKGPGAYVLPDVFGRQQAETLAKKGKRSHDGGEGSPVAARPEELPSGREQRQEDSTMPSTTQIRQMIRDVFREELLPELKQELAATVRRAVATYLSQPVKQATHAPIVNGLNPKQKQVFKDLRAITGTDTKARKEAEKILHGMTKTPLTERFVKDLQRWLKDKEWGLVCTGGPTGKCGMAAAPLWKPDSTCTETGGRMLLSHRDESGKAVLHTSNTTLPELTLAEKPDRRRARNR